MNSSRQNRRAAGLLSRANPRHATAFTLVEILVATAISSTVLLALFTVIGGSLSVFNRTQQTIDGNSDARFALGRIAADLSGHLTEAATIQFVENDSVLFNGVLPHVPENQNEAIFMISPSLNAEPGDLCIIAYRMNREALRLERAFVDSKEAWNNTPRYMASGYADLDWEPFIENVAGFEIDCFTEEEMQTEPPPEVPENDSWDSEDFGRPAMAVIRILSVDPDTAAQIIDSGGLDAFDEFIPTTYTRTVSF